MEINIQHREGTTALVNPDFQHQVCSQYLKLQLDLLPVEKYSIYIDYEL